MPPTASTSAFCPSIPAATSRSTSGGSPGESRESFPGDLWESLRMSGRAPRMYLRPSQPPYLG
eukprot:1394433-Amorphochlora_amoeboformis.AAC.1